MVLIKIRWLIYRFSLGLKSGCNNEMVVFNRLVEVVVSDCLIKSCLICFIIKICVTGTYYVSDAITVYVVQLLPNKMFFKTLSPFFENL